MYERPIGFSKLIRESCDYDLIHDLLNSLSSIATVKDGYYMYKYYTFESNDFIKHDVKYKRLSNGYKFIIDSKRGFLINKSNYTSNFEKLVNVIPIITMLEIMKHNFTGYTFPIDTHSYLYQLYCYSKNYLAYNNKMELTYDNDENEFTIKFISPSLFETEYFKVNDNGTATYKCKAQYNLGGIFISDNYSMASVIVLDNVKEFLRRNYFMTDELLKLAPLST